MSSQMILIMNISGILMLLAAVMVLIPWRKVGERIFANDATKGTLWIEMGGSENCEQDCVHAKYFYSNEKGSFYSYTWRKNDQIVAVPEDYGYKWLHGRRCLRLAQPGNVWASYWPKKKGPESIPAEVQKSAFDLNALIRGHVGVELVKTIYGAKKNIGLAVIIIILAAAAIGYYIYSNAQKPPAILPNPPAVQQQVPGPVNPDNVPYAK